MNKTKELNRKNNLLDKKISKENQEIFTDIICYIRSANLSDYDVEIVRRDLTEMILDAQERGESMTSLFSGDYRAFCDDVISAMSPKSKQEKTAYTLNLLSLCLSILIGINTVMSKDFIDLVRAIFTKRSINWSIGISMGSLINMMVLLVTAILLVQVICRTSFERRMNRGIVIAGGGLLGGLMTVIYLMGRKVVFSGNLFAVLGICLLLYGIHKGIENKYNLL